MVNGRMIYNKVMEQKSGQMVPDMKVTFMKELSKVKGIINGKMALLIKEFG